MKSLRSSDTNFTYHCAQYTRWQLDWFWDKVQKSILRKNHVHISTNCNNNNHAAPWVMSAVEVALQRPDLSWLMPQTTKLCIDFAVGCPWIFYAWWCNRPIERSYTGTQAVTHDTHIIQLCYLPNYYILFPSLFVGHRLCDVVHSRL